MLINKNRKILFFLGNSESHILHARSIYEQIGGSFIVLSEKSSEYLKKEGLPVIFLDNCPNTSWQIAPENVKRTLIFLNNLEKDSILLFFDVFTILPYIHTPLKIMLFHGIAIKQFYFSALRISLLKHFDKILTLGPNQEGILLSLGFNPKQFIKISQPRSDNIFTATQKEKKDSKNKILQLTKQKFEKIIAYLPTYWGDLTVDGIGYETVKEISEKHLVIFRPHPDTPEEIIKKYREIIKQKQNIIYLPEKAYTNIDIFDILLASDVFLVDTSSITLDAMITKKPLIFFYTKESDVYYKSLKDLYSLSCKIDIENHININNLIEKSSIIQKEILKSGIWERTTKDFYYSIDGDATTKFCKFLLTNQEWEYTKLKDTEILSNTLLDIKNKLLNLGDEIQNYIPSRRVEPNDSKALEFIKRLFKR